MLIKGKFMKSIKLLKKIIVKITLFFILPITLLSFGCNNINISADVEGSGVYQASQISIDGQEFTYDLFMENYGYDYTPSTDIVNAGDYDVAVKFGKEFFTYLVLNADGTITGQISSTAPQWYINYISSSEQEEKTGTWQLNGNELSITYNGETQICTYENNSFVFEYLTEMEEIQYIIVYNMR